MSLLIRILSLYDRMVHISVNHHQTFHDHFLMAFRLRLIVFFSNTSFSARSYFSLEGVATMRFNDHLQYLTSPFNSFLFPLQWHSSFICFKRWDQPHLYFVGYRRNLSTLSLLPNYVHVYFSLFSSRSMVYIRQEFNLCDEQPLHFHMCTMYCFQFDPY